jgi:hypothetical protein
MVTSSPSRIQAMPSAVTMRVWNLDHRNRSTRAGMSVLIDCPSLVGCSVASLT